jgi:hypothetical protein
MFIDKFKVSIKFYNKTDEKFTRTVFNGFTSENNEWNSITIKISVDYPFQVNSYSSIYNKFAFNSNSALKIVVAVTNQNSNSGLTAVDDIIYKNSCNCINRSKDYRFLKRFFKY